MSRLMFSGGTYDSGGSNPDCRAFSRASGGSRLRRNHPATDPGARATRRPRLRVHPEQPRVHRAAARVPPFRVPDERSVLRLVPDLRAARRVRAGLHEPTAVRLGERRPGAGARTVRLHGRDHRRLRALRPPPDRPAGRRAPRGRRPTRGGRRMTTAAESLGSPALNMTVFGAFVVVSLYVVYRVSRRNTSTSDYYAAGSAFTGSQNGVALTGDYLSAASFLGIAGAIAVHGYDGFLYSIGFLVAWLVALLLVAELVRNTGRFTMGD